MAHTAIIRVPGTRSTNTSLDDVVASFSSNLSSYGGSVVSKQETGGMIMFVMSMPNNKDFTQFFAFLDLMLSDLGGELTSVGDAYIEIIHRNTN